jgi:hypothetical protein
MAGKTIRLLQIVYGAELKRLFAEAQQFNEGLNNFNLKQAADDPQSFADQARSLHHLYVLLCNNVTVCHCRSFLSFLTFLGLVFVVSLEPKQ